MREKSGTAKDAGNTLCPGDKAPTSLLQEGLGCWTSHRNWHKDTQEIIDKWP